MSSSPDDEDGDDAPVDLDDVAEADLESSTDAAALLVREITLPVDPRLAVLDGPDCATGGDHRSSASRRLGCRRLKLRRRGEAALWAWLRPAMEERIHRVALKESRKRTFFTAVRRVPRSDAGRFPGSMVRDFPSCRGFRFGASKASSARLIARRE